MSESKKNITEQNTKNEILLMSIENFLTSIKKDVTLANKKIDSFRLMIKEYLKTPEKKE